jgi:hypothetical protein
MTRFFVEGWAPEYGSPLDQDRALSPEGSVDATVETGHWEPLEGADDGIARIAFVDGVRRVDARLAIEAGGMPAPGICGTFAVGATVWDRPGRRSEVGAVRIERWAVVAGGRSDTQPPVDLDPPYSTAASPSDDPEDLVKVLHTKMRRAEGEVASALALECFVVADGPLNELTARPTVGYVKSHRVTYLEPERNEVVGRLAPGQRTPLFTLSDYKRYSWYLRLAVLAGGHAWTGIVRCEVSGQLPLDEARRVADRTAAVLPLVASEAHLDPRAPQNLVPIGALERELRHRMGDPRLVYRALREAVVEEAS